MSKKGLVFIKMHGAGNDFVVVDMRDQTGEITPGLAKALGDRHFGVGFDQLVEIRTSDSADFGLIFWNSDGSRAGACGNATRCVCDYMMAALGRDHLSLSTERGLLSAERRGPDGVIAVNMGQPQLEWRDVPLSHAVDPLSLPLPHAPIAVGMGNPHCVLLLPDAEAVDITVLGPEYEHSPLYPQRTNVEFVSLLGPDHLRMRVWERGAGHTLACGSGACAAAVATNLRGLTGKNVQLDLDGGTLHVEWRKDGLWLSGPVAYVCDGVIHPDFLAGAA